MSPDAMASPIRRRLYLDTPAYLCVLLGEAGSARLSADTDGAELLSSVLLVLEARRNLVRLTREGALLDLAHLRTASWFHRIEPIAIASSRSTRPRPKPPGSLACRYECVSRAAPVPG